VSAPLLRCHALTRRFGALAALNGVSLEVEARERRAIIGPNGAGKTTLFDLITGELTPSAGHVEFAGKTISGLPPHTVARRGISRSYQRTNAFRHLTAGENLRLAAVREVAQAVGLGARLDILAGRLSHGEQRQLELGLALATRPRLLLLDEPTAGMSPAETQRMVRLLAALPREVSCLIIEHDMDLVFTLADRVSVLHHGEVLAEGLPEAVRGDPRVHEVYLGSAGEA